MTDASACMPPSSFLRNLEKLSDEYPVALLLRHSARDEILSGDFGNDIPITEIGRRAASQLGRVFGKRLKALHSSPLPRCVQTAESLCEGAGMHLDISTHRFLGDPGIFVLDGKVAWENWEALGNDGVMRHLALADHALPGMADPEEAVGMLLRYMLQNVESTPGIHVFVTHDAILAPVAARLLKRLTEISDWPAFLEGAFFWRSHTGIQILYKDYEACIA